MLYLVHCSEIFLAVFLTLDNNFDTFDNNECENVLQVKNIEYCRKTERLVSSAFDGAVFTWDLNNYTENGVINTRVYSMDGLMRMKLTPDCSKMVICSTSGYILIIHDLDFENLPSDLQRFKVKLIFILTLQCDILSF